MTTASLIIVADRGRLKAYRVRETPTRGPKLAIGSGVRNPKSEYHVANAPHDRDDRLAELESEENRHICAQLADEIAKIVERDFGEGWSLAAPESIYNQIVDLLPIEIRERIVEHLPCDLSKIPVARLRSHFRSLEPV